MPTHAHRSLRNTDNLFGFDEKPTEKPTEKLTEKPSVDRETSTEKPSVLVSVPFGLSRPKPTDVVGKHRKTERATFHFRFTTPHPAQLVSVPIPHHNNYEIIEAHTPKKK